MQKNDPDSTWDHATYDDNKGRQAGPGMQQRGTPMQRYQQPADMLPDAPPQFMAPMTVENPYYLSGYLREFIGKIVSVQFSLGTTGALTDRTGQLKEVGTDYIVLQQYPTNAELIGDLYSIKFVSLYPLNML